MSEISIFRCLLLFERSVKEVLVTLIKCDEVKDLTGVVNLNITINLIVFLHAGRCINVK